MKVDESHGNGGYTDGNAAGGCVKAELEGGGEGNLLETMVDLRVGCEGCVDVGCEGGRLATGAR